MLPDRVSNPGPLTYESGALPTALCGRAGYRYPVFIENRLLTFDRYTESNVCVSNKISIYSLRRVIGFVLNKTLFSVVNPAEFRFKNNKIHLLSRVGYL